MLRIAALPPVLGLAGLVAATALSACGGQSPTSTRTASQSVHRNAGLKLAECMRRHGVPNFPDPRVTTGPGGHGIAVAIGGPVGSGSTPRDFNPRSPAFQDAQKVCGRILGRIGPPPSQKAAG